MENKEILLKYLCMALPYGVICQVDDGAAGFNDGKLVEIDVSEELVRFGVEYWWQADIEYVKPFLRPMSSMTEEEHKEYEQWLPDGFNINTVNWLLEHHFDFMGLIPKDLAIEITDKNNPYEN